MLILTTNKTAIKHDTLVFNGTESHNAKHFTLNPVIIKKVRTVFMELFLPALLTLIVIACETGSHEGYKSVTRGMYFWQNDPDMAKEDFQKLNNLGVEKFYIKVFEVRPDPVHKAIPKSEVRFERNSSRLNRAADSAELVPVIYITNQTLSSLDSNDMRWLARKVIQKINPLIHHKRHQEIQIDCDWTATTKGKYFRFIKKLKRFSHKRISVSLRLHQIKDQDLMGVPPADRGVLMYYNMGNLTDYNETNSLLNNQVGRNYIQKNVSYDLPLDFALPAFSWGILFRYGEFEGIINDFHPRYLPKSVMRRKADSNWFQIHKDSSVKNKYFRYHDEIRYERAKPKNLLEAIDILKRIETPNDSTNVIFYNWHEAKNYDQQILDSVYSAF